VPVALAVTLVEPLLVTVATQETVADTVDKIDNVPDDVVNALRVAGGVAEVRDEIDFDGGVCDGVCVGVVVKVGVIVGVGVIDDDSERDDDGASLASPK
jgi:hypothetical protein